MCLTLFYLFSMLARALLARRALCAGASRPRPASALATAGLDADTADLWHAASDFADRELAPHSARWDEEKVEGGGGLCGWESVGG